MSYIIVSSDKVKAQCEKQLAWIAKLRAEMLGREVYKEAHKKRLFSQPWGYEKALASIDSNAVFSISLTFSAQESKCKALLTLAKNGDPVYVSDDAAWIMEEV